MWLYRYYDAGDGGGGDLAPEGAAPPAAPSATPGSDKAPATPSDRQPEPGIPEFADLNEAKSWANEMAKKHAETSKASDELKKAHEALKAKVGDQGNKLSDYKKLQEALASDPKEMIANLAKQFKVDLKAAGDNPKEPQLDPAQLLNMMSTDPEKARELLEEAAGANQSVNLEKMIDNKIAPFADMALETQLQQRHQDWDDLAEDRKLTNMKVMAKVMPFNELLHFAVRGQRIAEVGEAEYKRGYEKAEADMAKKMQEAGMSSGATAHTDPTKQQEARQKLGQALAFMYQKGQGI